MEMPLVKCKDQMGNPVWINPNQITFVEGMDDQPVVVVAFLGRGNHRYRCNGTALRQEWPMGNLDLERAMTDAEHVQRVSAAVNALNDAMVAARKAGVTVELSKSDHPEMPLSVYIRRTIHLYPIDDNEA